MKLLKSIIHFLSILSYIFIGFYALILSPKLLNYHPLVVLSGSMEPTFKTGSIIYYKSVPESELKVGDPITYIIDGTYASHRIYGINNGIYTTKGDANQGPDLKTITFQDIVGKDLDFSIPYIGYYVKYINEHLYLIPLILAILLLEMFFTNINDKKRR